MTANAQVSTDIVLFTVQADSMKVLLVRRAAKPFKGVWALPGGFVRHNEDLAECARRELEEETGVAGFYLEQLQTFGAPERDPRGRVITVAYYALIPSGDLVIQADSDADAAAWFPVGDLPELAFDHAEIVASAVKRLRAKLGYSTIAFQMLDEQFTLSAVQRIYEAITGTPVDKRNFRKLILGFGELEETGELSRDGAHRPAKLYRLIEPDKVTIIK
ncbi:MAG: NUDIX domain-containing protein [Pseudomonadota bacterium]